LNLPKGDVVSLVPKLYGIDLQTFAQHMGVTCEKVEGAQDQLLGDLTPAKPICPRVLAI
jgi:hypothetical protein